MNNLTPDREMVFTNLVMYLSPYGVGVRGRDNFSEFLVIPHAKEWRQACSIDYFQTNSSFYRKFGIAKDVKKRSQGNRGGHYKEKLSEHHCSTRAEALAIESTLKALIGTKNQNLSKEDYEIMHKGISSSQELSTSMVEEFDACVMK